MPIVVPAAGDSNVVQSQREFRASPDGRHVAFTQVRTTPSGLLDGVAVVGRLVRGRASYRVGDPRVVATGGELKNFAPDGRSVLLARYDGVAEAGNPDVVRVDLRTGRETRLTFWPDWEEDVDRAVRGAGWSSAAPVGRGLLETVAQIRRPLAITPAISALPFAVFALEPARIAEPWIVSLSAERRVRAGQPLVPGAVAHGWNSRANFTWNPDGTAIVFWQRAIADESRTRVVVSRLADRRPRRPRAVVPVPTPEWAPSLLGYVPPEAAPPRSRAGRRSGRMEVMLGTAPPGSGYERSITVRYRHFADHRGYVLDGAESGLYDPAGLFGGDSRYSADLRLSGRRTGSLRADGVVIGPGSISGTIRSRIGTHRLSLGPLPSRGG